MLGVGRCLTGVCVDVDLLFGGGVGVEVIVVVVEVLVEVGVAVAVVAFAGALLFVGVALFVVGDCCRRLRLNLPLRWSFNCCILFLCSF